VVDHLELVAVSHEFKKALPLFAAIDHHADISAECFERSAMGRETALIANLAIGALNSLPARCSPIAIDAMPSNIGTSPRCPSLVRFPRRFQRDPGTGKRLCQCQRANGVRGCDTHPYSLYRLWTWGRAAVTSTLLGQLRKERPRQPLRFLSSTC
jgi:hypothetical protein